VKLVADAGHRERGDASRAALVEVGDVEATVAAGEDDRLCAVASRPRRFALYI
jgi:hypothetical protein